MRETIIFTVQDVGEFEAYKVRTCGDDFKIENAAAEMCGGGTELVKYKIEVSATYEKIQSQAKKDVQNNLIDLAFLMDLNDNMKQIYSYAILKVMLIKIPEDLNKDLLQWTKEQLKLVYSAYEVALKPFSGDKQSPIDEKVSRGVHDN